MLKKDNRSEEEKRAARREVVQRVKAEKEARKIQAARNAVAEMTDEEFKQLIGGLEKLTGKKPQPQQVCVEAVSVEILVQTRLSITTSTMQISQGRGGR